MVNKILFTEEEFQAIYIEKAVIQIQTLVRGFLVREKRILDLPKQEKLNI